MLLVILMCVRTLQFNHAVYFSFLPHHVFSFFPCGALLFLFVMPLGTTFCV